MTTKLKNLIRFLIFNFCFIYVFGEHLVDCKSLLIGQYKCDDPKIDPETQQPFNCLKNNTVFVNCTLIDGLLCEHNLSSNFTLPQECLYTNGYYFETALLLSIFLGINFSKLYFWFSINNLNSFKIFILGVFGVDRFYLGYPAYGLIKFCTLGGFFFLYLLDVILIALQIVKPVDNSSYIIKYYGPKITILNTNDESDLWDFNFFIQSLI